MAQKIAEKIQSYTHIIWDWNGTLLDDLWAAVEAENKQIEKYDMPSIGLEKRRKIFHLPIKSYYESLGFDFEKISFEKVASEWMQDYEKLTPQIKLFEGTAELLKTLHSQKKRQFILSAAPETHLLEITQKYEIQSFFEKIYGLADHYAHSKLERGQDLLREQNLDLNDTVMIGDTDHDAEVAKELGIDILLVGDGHQSPCVLAQYTDNCLETRF